MSGIRVTYSGLIGFAVAIASVLTGIIFTLIVTRQLEPEEFGIWTIIGSMIGYLLATESVISYWTTRQIARGEPVGRTSLVSSSLFACGSAPIYVVFVYLFSGVDSEFLNSMLLATVLVPVMFVSKTLTGINLGHKPHATSIGILAFESLKIPAGLGLVFFLDLGVDGAITATLVAHLGMVAIQLRYAKEKLLTLLNFSYLRKWFRQSWIPLYNDMSGVIWTLDVVIFPIITNSIIGVAYYAASMTVANIIGHAGRISLALYPKLLAQGSHRHISENFLRMLYFAVPLLVITIVFSKHALFALNPEYASAGVVVILLAFRTFFYVLTGVFHQILMGVETVDVENNPRLSKLRQSKLFLVPTILNIHHALYIASLIISLYVFRGSSDLDLVTIWSAISVLLSVPFLIYAGLLVRGYVAFSALYGTASKYVIGGVALAVTFVLTNEHVVTFETSIYSYLPSLILELVLCSAVYLGVTYAIDNKTRKFFKLIISEMVHRRYSQRD